MLFGKYLEKNNITKKDFAEQVKISREHISLIASGTRRPGVRLAQKISELTGGAVSELELLYPDRFNGEKTNG